MKKIILSISLIIVLFLVYIFISYNSAIIRRSNMDDKMEDLRLTAVEVARNLNEQKYDIVYSEFSNNLKDKMSIDNLKSEFEKSKKNKGALVELAYDSSYTGEEEIKYCSVDIKYEKGTIYIKLTYNNKMEIDNIYIL